MCVGIDEIRDIALGQEMEGLEGWRYPYQRVIIDDKIGEIVGFWKQIAGGPRRSDGLRRIRDLRHRRQLVPPYRVDGVGKIEWQRDFFDFGHVSALYMDLIKAGKLSDGNAEAHRTRHGRREGARLLPARQVARRRSGRPPAV